MAVFGYCTDCEKEYSIDAFSTKITEEKGGRLLLESVCPGCGELSAVAIPKNNPHFQRDPKKTVKK